LKKKKIALVAYQREIDFDNKALQHNIAVGEEAGIIEFEENLSLNYKTYSKIENEIKYLNEEISKENKKLVEEINDKKY